MFTRKKKLTSDTPAGFTLNCGSVTLNNKCWTTQTHQCEKKKWRPTSAILEFTTWYQKILLITQTWTWTLISKLGRKKDAHSMKYKPKYTLTMLIAQTGQTLNRI